MTSFVDDQSLFQNLMSLAGVNSAHCGTQSGGDGTHSDDWSFFDSTKLTSCKKFDCNTGTGQIIYQIPF